MYVVFNSDGSIKYKQLNTFVQKGNSYVDELKVAIIGYTPEQYTLTLVPTLPDGTTVSALLGSSADVVLDDLTFAGQKFSFPDTITAQEGKLTINITATDLQQHTLVSSNVYITVNPSGVASSDPVYLSKAEWYQLVSGLGQYALKFSERTIRKYATLQEAQSDVANLVLNQVVVVKDSNSKYQLYEKTASSTLTQVEMPYLRLSGGTMTGDLNMNGNKIMLDDVEITGDEDWLDIKGHAIPDDNNTYNLGATLYKWKNLWLSGELKDGTNSVTVANIETKDNAQATYIPLTQKAQALGVATLDVNSKIVTNQIPDVILGQLKYKGVWNASTGTSGLEKQKGDYYVCQVGGSKNPDATTYSGSAYAVGDWSVYNGSSWDKIDNTDAVSSVNGMTGAVSITPQNIGALPTSGGTMSGNINLNGNKILLRGVNGALIETNQYGTPLIKMRTGAYYNFTESAFYTTGYSLDLGSSNFKWKDLYLSGSLKDGTNSIAISEIATKTYTTDSINAIDYLKSFTWSYSGDTVNISKVHHNGTSGQDETLTENIQLASSTQAGLMPLESYNKVEQLVTDVAALKGQTVRLLYTASSSPTAQQILNFVVSKGYTDPTKYDSIAVVIDNTNHVWKWVNETKVSGTWIWKNTLPSISGISNLSGASFTSNNETYSIVTLQLLGDVFKVIYAKTAHLYDVVFENGAWNNDAYKTMNYGSTNKNVNTSFLTYLIANTDTQGTYSYGYFQDFGLDTVNTFTNNIAGIIKGKNANGYVFAEADGTGSVVGWDATQTAITNLQNTKQDAYPTRIFTIPANGWVNKKYTYTITGLTIGANDIIQVGCQASAYYNNQIRYGQGTTVQDIEFTCVSVPTEDLSISIIIMPVA